MHGGTNQARRFTVLILSPRYSFSLYHVKNKVILKGHKLHLLQLVRNILVPINNKSLVTFTTNYLILERDGSADGMEMVVTSKKLKKNA